MAAELSAAARAVWAKFDRYSDGSLRLYRHMSDTAVIVRYLYRGARRSARADCRGDDSGCHRNDPK